MDNKIPDYINEKGNIWRLVLLTALFALVFINIYTPFGSENWYHVPRITFFIYSSLIILTGVLVVVISRITMYQVTRKRKLVYWNYILWVATEIFFMSAFYTFYTKILNPRRELIDIFYQSATNTSLVLLLPYSTLWLYFSLIDKQKKLESLKQEEESLINNRLNMISFRDEKGDFRLSVNSDNLLYLESADNYVNIRYLNKGKLSNFMLRNSLKALEKELAENRYMVRCHRSYMINFDKVKVMRRGKEGIFLELDHEQTPDIPVSNTYIERITGLFSQLS